MNKQLHANEPTSASAQPTARPAPGQPQCSLADAERGEEEEQVRECSVRNVIVFAAVERQIHLGVSAG